MTTTLTTTTQTWALRLLNAARDRAYLLAVAALVGVLGAGTALSLRRAVSVQPAINDPAGAVAAGVASVLLVGPLLHLVSRLPIT